MANCPYCGTPLKDTTYGRRFCPNCGVIDEPKNEPEEKKESYIG